MVKKEHLRVLLGTGRFVSALCRRAYDVKLFYYWGGGVVLVSSSSCRNELFWCANFRMLLVHLILPKRRQIFHKISESIGHVNDVPSKGNSTAFMYLVGQL